jgi:hypothetical protein
VTAASADGHAVAAHPRAVPVRVDASGGGDVRADTAALAARATQVARGGARAAVLGVSDGLVTNICLILGIAGAQASARDVRLAGIASLIAGAVSMAAGEWVSVRSQVELFRGVLDDLRRLVARNPPRRSSRSTSHGSSASPRCRCSA